MEPTFHLSDAADEVTRQAILAPLRQFNSAQAGPSGHQPLAIELRDAQGQTIGGLWGATSYGWLFTQLLVVPEPLRGKGTGRKLMEMAESEAVHRGCHAAWLDTFEFQARAFYERLGYQCFGQLDKYPVGFARYFMQKSLGLGHNARAPTA